MPMPIAQYKYLYTPSDIYTHRVSVDQLSYFGCEFGAYDTFYFCSWDLPWAEGMPAHCMVHVNITNEDLVVDKSITTVDTDEFKCTYSGNAQCMNQIYFMKYRKVNNIGAAQLVFLNHSLTYIVEATGSIDGLSVFDTYTNEDNSSSMGVKLASGDITYSTDDIAGYYYAYSPQRFYRISQALEKIENSGIYFYATYDGVYNCWCDISDKIPTNCYYNIQGRKSVANLYDPDGVLLSKCRMATYYSLHCRCLNDNKYVFANLRKVKSRQEAKVVLSRVPYETLGEYARQYFTNDLYQQAQHAAENFSKDVLRDSNYIIIPQPGWSESGPIVFTVEDTYREGSQDKINYAAIVHDYKKQIAAYYTDEINPYSITNDPEDYNSFNMQDLYKDADFDAFRKDINQSLDGDPFAKKNNATDENPAFKPDYSPHDTQRFYVLAEWCWGTCCDNNSSHTNYTPPKKPKFVFSAECSLDLLALFSTKAIFKLRISADSSFTSTLRFSDGFKRDFHSYRDYNSRITRIIIKNKINYGILKASVSVKSLRNSETKTYNFSFDLSKTKTLGDILHPIGEGSGFMFNHGDPDYVILVRD